MRRWHLALGLAMAAVAIAAPVVVVRWLTDDALPAEAVTPVNRSDIAWAAVFGPEANGAYQLVGGGVTDGVPSFATELRLDVDPGAHPRIAPSFGAPVDGAVVFLTDDGASSIVWRMDASSAQPTPLAELPQVIRSMAVSPDGSVAYLAGVSRDDGREDGGIVRVALDGSGTSEPITDLLPLRPDAADAAFEVTLHLSSDGRLLGRSPCEGRDACGTEIVDVETHDVRLSVLPIFELGRDGVALRESCNDTGCTAEIYDTGTDETVPLRSHPFDTTFRSTLLGEVVVAIVPLDGGTAVVRVDPATGGETVIHRSPDGASVTLADRGVARWEVPDGWVLINEQQGLQDRYLLIPIEGGEVLDLGPAPWGDAG